MCGAQLREARLRCGYTQQELGALIGKDKILICKIEAGYCMPTEEDLQIICNALKIDPKSEVATAKTRVATRVAEKSSTNTYNYLVRVPRSEIPLLTKENLKKCGMRSSKEFLLHAYKQFAKKLNRIKKGEQDDS